MDKWNIKKGIEEKLQNTWSSNTWVKGGFNNNNIRNEANDARREMTIETAKQSEYMQTQNRKQANTTITVPETTME